MLLLGIALKANGAQAIALDLESGRIVSDGTSHYDFDLADGCDPTGWIESVDAAMRHCLANIDPMSIAAMGVSAFAGSQVYLDGQNAVVQPAFHPDDERAADEALEVMLSYGGAPGMIEMGSNRQRPSDTPARLRWLQKHAPEAGEQVAHVLSPLAFINYWLTGTMVSDFSDASTTGLFDTQQRTWRSELTEPFAAGREGFFGNVQPSDGTAGILRPEIAASWGMGESVVVSAGASLRASHAIGCGAVLPSSVLLDIGSEARLCGIASEALVDPRGEIDSRCDATGRWMPSVHIANGLSSLEIVRSHYQLSEESFYEMAGNAPAGSEGLRLLPYFRPESTPSTIGANGLFTGLNATNFTVANVCRAAVEALAYSCAYGLSRLRELGVEVASVSLSGAGASQPLIRSVLASACGCDVISVSTDAPEALGSAMQAGIAFIRRSGESLSYLELADYLVTLDEQTRCHPDPVTHGIYAEAISQRQYFAETLQDAGFL